MVNVQTIGPAMSTDTEMASSTEKIGGKKSTGVDIIIVATTNTFREPVSSINKRAIRDTPRLLRRPQQECTQVQYGSIPRVASRGINIAEDPLLGPEYSQYDGRFNGMQCGHSNMAPPI